MKRKRPETNEADHAGREPGAAPPGRHVTVAYSGNAADVLRDVIRDHLSPHAVAAIAAYLGVPAATHRGGVPLHPVRTTDAEASRQIRWFADQLTELVGGPEARDRLAKEVGL